MLKTEKIIDFKPFTPEDKSLYEKYLFSEEGRGCEFSFANLYLWGRQSFAVVCEHIVMFSQFDRRTVYPYPLGEGDKKPVLDAIIADAHARGIPCRISGIVGNEAETRESLYPGKFRFHCDRGSYDYVYDINDLAELSGKKYHGKKNHLNRFKENCEGYVAEPISEKNLNTVREFAENWFNTRISENPESDFHMERAAIERALNHYGELMLEGILITYNGEALAFTIGSRLSSDTFDVHFEKARSDVNGAYTAINYEFARYIREKYPEVKYLDREEDMGLEGLRRAKESYKPHHMVEKCWAHLLEDGYDY